MSWQVSRSCGRYMFALYVISVAGVLFVGPPLLRAQFVQQSIGGIAINSHGMVSQPTLADRHAFLKLVREQMRAVPDDLLGPADLRKVSLRQLQSAIAVAIKKAANGIDTAADYSAFVERFRNQ